MDQFVAMSFVSHPCHTSLSMHPGNNSLQIKAITNELMVIWSVGNIGENRGEYKERESLG